MTIATNSLFTYGHTITDTNKYININEGSGEITTTIEVGSYSLGEFVDKVAEALNDIGSQLYTVTLDRLTRLITISAPGVFDLLITSGTNVSQSAFSLIGFTGADLTGIATYEANSQTGSVYSPQYKLIKYVPFEHIVKTNNVNVNEAPGGELEVVSWGRVNYMECNIKYITDITGQGVIINNATGVQDYIDFITYATLKRPIEFIESDQDVNTFSKCVLESTPQSSKGVDFDLEELYGEKLAYYYQSGKLTFRRLT